MTDFKILDVVAAADDMPSKNLARGHVGTMVELLGPDVFEVEFCDDEGRTHMSTALNASQLILLHYKPQVAV